MEIVKPERLLYNLTCASIISEPKLDETSNDVAAKLRSAVTSVVEAGNPEFVFKTIFYLRTKLNLRTTPLYLLSVAVSITECKPFIRKWFSHIILTPGDLLSFWKMWKTRNVDTQVQMPTGVRKAVADCFLVFSPYQVAKYDNRRKVRRQAFKAKTSTVRAAEQQKKLAQRPSPVVARRSRSRQAQPKQKRLKPVKVIPPPSDIDKITLAHIVKSCHVAEPANTICGLLGKKYPRTEEEFTKMKMTGKFDPDKAGKRMSLPPIETWDRALSAQGNTYQVWHQLLDNRSVPFMATLRNLRNLLEVGIDREHHDQILALLNKEEAVINSKQFPTRFLTAYEAISTTHFTNEKLTDMKTKAEQGKKSGQYFEMVAPDDTQQRKRKWANALHSLHEMGLEDDAILMNWLDHYNGNLERTINSVFNADPFPRSFGKAKTVEKMKKKALPYEAPTKELLQQYSTALDNALKYSVNNNIPCLRGNVVILCDVSGSMDMAMSQSVAFGIGGTKVPKIVDIAYLLGCMILYTAEQAELRLFGSSPDDNYDKACHTKVEVNTDSSIFDNIESCRKQRKTVDSGTQFPFELIEEWKKNKNCVDMLILLSDMAIPPFKKEGTTFDIEDSIQSYRDTVNDELKFVCIDLIGGGKTQIDMDSMNANPNNVLISGFGDSVLSLLAAYQGDPLKLIAELSVDGPKQPSKRSVAKDAYAKPGSSSSGSATTDEAAPVDDPLMYASAPLAPVGADDEGDSALFDDEMCD